MTHTEESLAHLINDALNTAEKAEADHCSPMGSPQFRQSNADAREAETALRLAIREVLAERDMHKDEAEAQRILRNQQRERAEKAEAETQTWKNYSELQFNRAAKAEAERDDLRKDAERYLFLKTLEGQAEYIMVIRNKGAEHLDAAIDAALKEQP